MLNKHRRLTIFFITFLVIFSIVAILIGSNGTALTARKEVFTYKINTEITKDAKHYFKGVIEPSKFTIDYSNVNNKKCGTYLVKAKQGFQRYSFKIKITK
ncbi:MAG: hypothetical protein RR802_09790 [Erysipelotrichaceae bacterium]